MTDDDEQRWPTTIAEYVARHGDESDPVIANILSGLAWLEGDVIRAMRAEKPGKYRTLVLPITESHGLALAATMDALGAVADGAAYQIIKNNVAPGVLSKARHPTNDEEACEEIAKITGQHGRYLLRYLNKNLPTKKWNGRGKPPEDVPDIESGILAIDEYFARYLEEHIPGAPTKNRTDTVEKVRRKSAKRKQEYDGTQLQLDGLEAGPGNLWSLWIDPSGNLQAPRFLTLLAKVLWNDYIRREMEQKRRSIAPALARGVHTSITDTYHSRGNIPEQLSMVGILKHKDGVESIDPIHQKTLAKRLDCPAIDADIFSALTEKMDAARGVVGQLALRHLIIVGYNQTVVNPTPEPRVYTIEGGRQEFLRRIRRNPRSGTDWRDLGDALDAYEILRITLPRGGHDGVLKWSERKPAGGARGQRGQRAEIQIVMMDPIMPGYVHYMPKATKGDYRARILVPITGQPPPLTGSPNTYGGQIRLQSFVIELMAANCREYAKHNGITIDRSTWMRLADRAMLPRKETSGVVDGFIKGSEATAPFLVYQDGRYRLAPVYADPVEKLILWSGNYREKKAVAALMGPGGKGKRR